MAPQKKHRQRRDLVAGLPERGGYAIIGRKYEWEGIFVNDRLTVGDGFKFGCGFIAAGCVFYVCAMALAALAMGAMMLLGMGSLLPQLQNLMR